MDAFVWNDNFETGLSKIDEEHQELVRIINHFGKLLSEHKVVFSDIETTLNELLDYTHYHFKEEEEFMVGYALDSRHLDHHFRAHEHFLDEVVVLKNSFSKGSLDSAKSLLDFLSHWLAYHILGEDQNLSRQIAKIKSGATPLEAYEEEERERDKATEPLLNALSGLFQQISLRNKDLMELNESLEQKVELRTKELSEANLKLEELSSTDVLTGLPNRRHAMRLLALLWEQAINENIPLVCMMIDADHFKQVNDTYGHDAGDSVLTELAQTLKHAFRTDDIVCRLGGDEFLVICPDTKLEGGMHIGELTRKAVAELKVATGGDPWLGSISVGVAARTPEMESFEELIKKADLGVYAAKRAGKNCVKTAND